ncbi:MAG: hypothetical protein ACE145_05975 [Terriglobia bacterium]
MKQEFCRHRLEFTFGEGARGLRYAALALALVVALPSFLLAAKTDPKELARIALIRGLAQEVGVSKVAMPRGKRGLVLDAQGKVDQEKSDAEMRANGMAIKPGMPIQITKVVFKSGQITFEINGGGKKGKKWYQRIEIGMGTTTAPITRDAPVLAFGSSVTLLLAEKEKYPTVEKAKELLGSVVDFTRRSPTTLYTPQVAPEIKEAIKKHQVLVGMDRDSVLSSKGPPDRRVREVRDGVEQEDWIYGLPPHVLFVTFDGDTVTKVTQY